MFDFGSAPDRRKICGGCVHCPLRGADLDVDDCIECDWVESIYRHGDEGFVRCRPASLSDESPLMHPA